MSIIVGWLSKIALSKVIKYLKENKAEFILFIIISICFTIIIFMFIRLKSNDRHIDELNIKIEALTTTNIFYQKEVIDREKEIKELLTYTNSLGKINKTILYIMPETDIIAYDSISNDFMETQAK